MRRSRTGPFADGGGSMRDDSSVVRFLYGTSPGRCLLNFMLRTRTDQLVVRFLWSRASRPVVLWYAKRHGIQLPPEQMKQYKTFREFFIRQKDSIVVDRTPEHLISPCDGWLSIYPIQEDSSFLIKGKVYRLNDLLEDKELSIRYHGGVCLIFRLTPADYHHYIYFDDGYQGENHFIPGSLHSVQNIACSVYPVYTLNRRMWTLLATEHFGPVVQTEVGAFAVGGILPSRSRGRFCRGMEMGRFELAGSTIVLLFEKDRIRLLPHLADALKELEEIRVEMGMWIGNVIERQNTRYFGDGALS